MNCMVSTDMMSQEVLPGLFLHHCSNMQHVWSMDTVPLLLQCIISCLIVPFLLCLLYIFCFLDAMDSFVEETGIRSFLGSLQDGSITTSITQVMSVSVTGSRHLSVSMFIWRVRKDVFVELHKSRRPLSLCALWTFVTLNDEIILAHVQDVSRISNHSQHKLVLP